MKRILLLACVLAAANGAQAQLYKWVDKDGRVSYSDKPPPSQQAKELKVPTGPAVPAPRSAVERVKELEKARAAEPDKAKAAEDAARKAKIDEENCTRAKANLRTLSYGGRIATYNEQGERVLMDDKQIEERKAAAEKAVEEACKAS